MIGPGEGIGGGISTLIETFLPGLQKRVLINYFPSVKNRELSASGIFSLNNFINAISQYGRFLLALPQYRPNIIHLHTSQGLAWIKDTFYIIIAKLANCRILLHMHGGNFDHIYQRSSRFGKAYTRYILGLTDMIISVSGEWKTRLSFLISPDRIYPLLNCIDCDSIQPGLTKLNSEQIHILFIGRIGQNKGVFDLVAALENLQSKGLLVKAKFIGAEEKLGDFQKLKKIIAQYGLSDKCELLGSVSRAEALRLLQSTSVFVLPSYYEGLPLVILEAMATGLPVVATSVGGIPEAIRDEYNGYIVPVGDTQLLADRLARLAGDGELRRVMGQRSREIAENMFDVGIYIDKLENLYSQVVSR